MTLTLSVRVVIFTRTTLTLVLLVVPLLLQIVLKHALLRQAQARTERLR